MVIPTTIRLVDFTSSLLLFDSASSGYAVATIGGDLPAISSSYAGYTLQVANSAPYSASWVAIPNVTVTNAVSSSFAATASSADNLTVRGTLTAQTINVQTITSSIDFVTGSAKFGSLSTNTHQFTGSVLMSGSLNVGSASVFSSTVTAQNGFKLPANGNGTSPTLAYNNSLGFGVSGTGIFFGNLYNSDLTTAMQLRVTNAGGTDVTAMTLLSSGNVGIGTTSPNTYIDGSTGLAINGSARGVLSLIGTSSTANEVLGRLLFTNTNTTNAASRLVIIDGVRGADNNSGYLTFSTSNSGAPAERMRITSAGNVVINSAGTSAPNSGQLVNRQKSDVTTPYLNGIVNMAEATSTYLNIYYDNSVHNISATYYTGGDGGAYKPIAFQTSDVERMRITNGGNIRIGTSTANPTELLEVNSSSGGSATHYTLFLYNTRSGGQSSGDHYVRFYSNTTNGSIRSNGAGGVDYNTTSDSRLKLDPKDFDAISIINKMKPKNFKWKDYNITSEGFYAQELYDVYPQAVSVGNDELTEDGKLKNPWQVDHSKLVPVLVKSIQELSAKNTTLEERLTALENK
jgi:hypothetical protein